MPEQVQSHEQFINKLIKPVKNELSLKNNAIDQLFESNSGHDAIIGKLTNNQEKINFLTFLLIFFQYFFIHVA